MKGPQSLYLMRLLLGAAEAGFFPGVILYLTYWFPAEYIADGSSDCSRPRFRYRVFSARPSRQLSWEPMDGLGSAAGNGCSSWKAIPAVLLGLACLAVLSDRPADATWLGDEERRWLIAQASG